MNLASELEIIRRVPFFKAITPSLHKLLCFSSDCLSYEAGQVLFREGDAPDAAYLVLEGAVEISMRTPQGPRVINRLGSSELLGETAILGDSARTATATALGHVEALRIGKDLFYSIVRECPEAALQLSSSLAGRLAQITAQLGGDARTRG